MDKRFHKKFSDGWRSRFLKRWGLRNRAFRGESGDADESAILRELPIVKEIIRPYSLSDIWNADEFGLFYCMAPSKTISRLQMGGRKKTKTRITGLACCNGDGSEKFPLMFIGKSFKPRCFNKKTGQQLGFDYHNNEKAWMRAPLFFDWLHRFDQYIRKTPGRKVVLLIDNCSAHGTLDTVPTFAAVSVVFLPPNTTSRIQPLDAGIIAAMKVAFRRKQMERALDYVDLDVGKLYQIDQLTAMRWITEVWGAISQKTIQNCWRETGVVDEKLPICLSDDLEGESVSNDKHRSALQELMSTVVSSQDCLPYDEFVFPSGENNCTEVISDESMVSSVLESLLESCSEEGSTDLEGEPGHELPCIRKQLEAITWAKLILESKFPDEKEALKGLTEAQRSLRNEHKRKMSQTRIGDFFKPLK